MAAARRLRSLGAHFRNTLEEEGRPIFPRAPVSYRLQEFVVPGAVLRLATMRECADTIPVAAQGK